MQETALWIPRGAFCPLEGGAQTHWHRHIGTSLTRASQTCSMGDMSGEYAGHARTGMFFSFQELYTDPCNMGPCIIMLQHEMMVGDEWHNNGSQDICE